MSITRRVEIFKEVRDLPYHIAADGEPDCSCATKSAVLQRRLASLGLGSKFILGKFRWPDLNLPGQILSLLPDDVGWHQLLSVYIPETCRWVDVDPSWDAALSGKLPVAEWDGLSGTGSGVPLFYRATDAEAAQALLLGYQPAAVSSYMELHRKFISALNCYLEGVRKG